MSLQDWRQHPQDFLLIQNTHTDDDGNAYASHHIIEFDQSRSISHIIEDDQIRQTIVKNMIAAGVLIMASDDVKAKELLKPKNFRSFQHELFVKTNPR